MDRLQSGLNPNLAATVADKLWQFQLRKENKAILDQLQENERRRQADAAEAERKLKESADRIKALESRLSEVEREKIKEDQARKEFMKVDAAFKANFKTFLEGRLYEDGLWDIMRRPSTNASTPAPSSGDAGPYGKVPSSEPVASHRSKPIPTTVLPSLAGHETCDANNKQNDQSEKTSRPRLKPTIARRPITRSRNRAAETPTETPVEPPLARPAAPKLPRLSQGTGHIKTYYNNANDVFKTLNMSDPQTEIDFISAFIKGIADSKIGNKLLTELQQRHPSRSRKDGRIEVLCDWDDVPEGLRKAGLLSPSKEPSRRNHRVLGDLSDLGF